MATASTLNADHQRLRLRLTATWALSEGLLGGLLHALKVPFTGLVVGSAAVVCLALLGWYRERPGQILRATLVVVIIKALLSPHAPLPAYLAVLFQGLVAEAVLRGRGAYRLRCAVLGSLALVESAIQKLLVLSLLFGQSIWQAADAFLSSLLQQFGFVPAAYASLLAGTYVGLHLLAGLAVGWWAGHLAGRATRYADPAADETPVRSPGLTGDNSRPLPAPHISARPAGARRPGWRTGVVLALGLVAVLVLEPAWLPRHAVARLLVRSVGLLLIWYWLIGPVVGRWFQGWLARQRHYRLATEVDAVLGLLPEMRALLSRSWRDTAAEPSSGRWLSFVRLAATRLVAEREAPAPAEIRSASL